MDSTAYHMNAEFAAIMGTIDEDAVRAAAAIDALEAELDGHMDKAEAIRKDASEAIIAAGMGR